MPKRARSRSPSDDSRHSASKRRKRKKGSSSSSSNEASPDAMDEALEARRAAAAAAAVAKMLSGGRKKAAAEVPEKSKKSEKHGKKKVSSKKKEELRKEPPPLPVKKNTEKQRKKDKSDKKSEEKKRKPLVAKTRSVSEPPEEMSPPIPEDKWNKKSDEKNRKPSVNTRSVSEAPEELPPPIPVDDPPPVRLRAPEELPPPIPVDVPPPVRLRAPEELPPPIPVDDPPPVRLRAPEELPPPIPVDVPPPVPQQRRKERREFKEKARERSASTKRSEDEDVRRDPSEDNPRSRIPNFAGVVAPAFAVGMRSPARRRDASASPLGQLSPSGSDAEEEGHTRSQLASFFGAVAQPIAVGMRSPARRRDVSASPLGRLSPSASDAEAKADAPAPPATASEVTMAATASAAVAAAGGLEVAALGRLGVPRIEMKLPEPAQEHQFRSRERRIAETSEKRLVEDEVKEIPCVLVPQIDRGKAPCALPIWCVSPNRDDIVREVEIVRVLQKGGSASSRSRRLLLGRRPWVLLGRRDKQNAGPEPDIGLGSARASRKHAVILQNWKGQVFLMDLGSAHGCFLGNKKCPPNKPCEWKVDVTAYFADKSVEVFRLQDVAKSAPIPPTLPPQPLQESLVITTAAAKTTVELPPPPEVSSEPMEPLYPGEWAVPAVGITELQQRAARANGEDHNESPASPQ